VLVDLDQDIAALRSTIAQSSSSLPSAREAEGDSQSPARKPSQYDFIDDIAKLQRLVKAKEKTRASLESKAAWAGMEAATAA
jgi:hypothetical protein